MGCPKSTFYFELLLLFSCHTHNVFLNFDSFLGIMLEFIPLDKGYTHISFRAMSFFTSCLLGGIIVFSKQDQKDKLFKTLIKPFYLKGL